MTHPLNRRILTVDDNAAIHEDFRKILLDAGQPASALLDEAEAALFGDDEPAASRASSPSAMEAPEYTLTPASQGAEAFERVKEARASGQPYALVFLDVRMPPGWDGVETARRLWEVDADLQIVLCTAYSDYSWQETVAALGRTDRLLILKKPFDRVEVCQLASALTEKWNLVQSERVSLAAARRSELEARAYAASLETLNRALETSWARSQSELERRREFVLKLASEVLAPAQLLLVERLDLAGLARGEATADRNLDRVIDPSIAIISAITHALEFAALEAGTASLRRGACAPIDVVQAIAGRVAATARERGIEFRLHCGTGIPVRIETDVERLDQILTELVENALRHGTGGSVELSLETAPTIAHDGEALRFLVSDTGAGVQREALASMFEPFNSPERTRAGLGLAVAKRNATLLGAELACESRDERNARFALTLPIRRT